MKMEDIDGGLHPAVDGQSLDEDEDELSGGVVWIPCSVARWCLNLRALVCGIF